MNRLIGPIIIILFIVIFIAKLWSQKLEHLTLKSDEAVQNLYSLYNKDNFYFGTLTSEIANIKKADTDTIKLKKLYVGDKWLFSGVGDASANDDWLRLYKTDGSAAYYGGLAAGKLSDSRIGDLVDVKNKLQGGIDGTNARINNISGVRDNIRCVDGYDLTGELQSSGIADCTNQCASRFPGTMCAQLRKSDNRCWCKSALGLTAMGDSNFTANLMPIPPPPPPPPPPGSVPQCVVM